MADITLLATADWDHPLWTNKQHVACGLAELGHRVLYVESLGLRPPRQGPKGPAPTQARSDRARIWRRLRHGLLPPRQVRPGLWVWSPLVLPGAHRGFALRCNRLLLGLGLAVWRLLLGLRADWIWTYNPMTLAVLDPRPWRRLIYHCVDAIDKQPDMPAAEMKHWEEKLCRAADVVFVTSPKLLQDLLPLNPLTFFYANVADVGHFAQAMQAHLSVPDDVAFLPTPRIGFVGACSAYKLALTSLALLAQKHPEWCFVMIGPVGEGDPETDILELQRLTNVHFLGTRSYASLPSYMKAFDVGLLPLQLNHYTQAMFPMKFFEYLAAGLPVVATAIESLQAHDDLALLCQPTAEGFEVAIARALAGEGPSLDKRLAGAHAHTYSQRTKAMLAHISALPQ